MNHKLTTRKSYNLAAGDFAKRDRLTVEESLEVKDALEKFMDLVPGGGIILDIGCGSGRDSTIFSHRGYRVVGIDFSREMVEYAKKANPRGKYRVMDLEDLKFKYKFDGIWANASLHHIPKSCLKAVLGRIYVLLKPGGTFFVKVKHGSKEGLRENIKFDKILKRYFAFYKVGELRKLVKSAKFKILSVKTATRGEWVDLFASK